MGGEECVRGSKKLYVSDRLKDLNTRLFYMKFGLKG